MNSVDFLEFKTLLKNLQVVDLIIIQDEERESILNNLYSCYNVKKMILPVSIKKVNSLSYKKKLKSSIILGQIGSLGNNKLTKQIVEKIKKQYCILLLGNISNDIKNEVAKNDNVKIFDLQNTYRNMRNIISEINIGIVAYKYKGVNNFFLKKASGQLIEFLHIGIPVIIINNRNIGEFVESEKCGVFINEVNNIENAISKINNNYEVFSKNAIKTFDNYYNLLNYQNRIIETINNL